MTIGILGGGVWGSALARVLSNNKVIIYARDEKIVKSINEHKINPKLKYSSFNENVTATTSLKEIRNVKFLFITLPAQNIREVIKDSSLTIVNQGRVELFENAKSVSQRMYEAQKFRVLSIKENDDATFEINGLEYNPSKFSAADQKGIVRKPVLPIPPQVDMGVPEEPRNLILTDLTLR